MGSVAVEDQSAVVLGDAQRLIGQQGCHAKLGVARQNAEHRFQLRIETVQRPDAAQALLCRLVSQGVRNDHADLLVSATECGDLVAVEGDLAIHVGNPPDGRRIDLLLPGIVELHEEVVDVEVLDPLEQAAQQARLGALLVVADETAVVLV